jgi:hypothetical protein
MLKTKPVSDEEKSYHSYFKELLNIAERIKAEFSIKYSQTNPISDNLK